MNGRPLTINWVAENSPAILETWFAGTQGGNAIADVLFGDVNPGGKLPVTFRAQSGKFRSTTTTKTPAARRTPNNNTRQISGRAV